jgi:excinuclease UvrABC nuclease subunit
MREGAGEMSRWTDRDYAGTDWNFPPIAGCYVFYCDGKAFYVGQTRSLFKRISSYKIRFSYGSGIITPWGVFMSVRVKYSVSRKYGDWAMRELRLIRRIQPEGNCIGSTRKRVFSS